MTPPSKGAPRRIHMFLDDATNLDFHRALATQARQEVEKLEGVLGEPVLLSFYECFGSQLQQRKLVLEVAAQLSPQTEDLICLLPTDAYAIQELQSALFAGPGVSWPGGRRRLVCAIMHQLLPEELAGEARALGRRLFSVCADQAEMGALQASQIVHLLSRKSDRERRIVFVSGPSHSGATRLRIAGAVEQLLEQNIVVEPTHSDWSGAKTRDALKEWKAAGNELQTLAAIAAQNDQIADAAKEWLLSEGRGDIPVLGMDGTDELGKLLVDCGKLYATVKQPLGIAEAFDTYRRLLVEGDALDDIHENFNRRLSPESYPPIATLAPIP